MKRRKNDTFISFGRELIKVEINLFIEGMMLILFRGLNILRFLIDFKFTPDFEADIKVAISNKLKESLKRDIDLPCENNKKINDIPGIPKVRMFMKNESFC